MSEPLYLNDTEKQLLLQIARNALTDFLTGEQHPLPPNLPPALHEKCGAFVTLFGRNHTLRGCIGRVEGVETPLYRTVQEMAIAAASRDYRFPPVTAAELPDIHIEISVLSVPQKIDDPAKLEVGRHGIIIRKGGAVGLLLPQVATSRGWNRYQFLEAVCQKAHLPPGSWRTADLFVFESEVFEEG